MPQQRPEVMRGMVQTGLLAIKLSLQPAGRNDNTTAYHTPPFECSSLNGHSREPSGESPVLRGASRDSRSVDHGDSRNSDGHRSNNGSQSLAGKGSSRLNNALAAPEHRKKANGGSISKPLAASHSDSSKR